MNAKKLAKFNVLTIKCNDGPFHGQTIYLSVDNNTFTFTFTAKGQTGYYKNGDWHAIS